MKFNKILLLVLLSISSFSFTQEDIKNLDKTENTDLRQNKVSFGLTTSLVGAGYFSGKEGLLSQISLEMYAGSSNNTGYMYIVHQVVTPIIEPFSNNIFSGTFLQNGIGYGKWVYQKLDINNKGWLIGVNMAFLSGIYNQYVADQDKGALNGWLFGLGLTTNMRAIYQLNKDFGFIVGIDITYYYPFSFTTGLDPVHGLTGGVTMGIAF